MSIAKLKRLLWSKKPEKRSKNMREKLITVLKDPTLVKSLLEILPAYSNIYLAIDECLKGTDQNKRQDQIELAKNQVRYKRDLVDIAQTGVRGQEQWIIKATLKFDKVNNPITGENYYTIHEPGRILQDSYQISVIRKGKPSEIIAYSEMFLPKYGALVASSIGKDINVDVKMAHAYSHSPDYGKLELDKDGQIEMSISV